MDLQAFCATAHAPTDKEWEEVGHDLGNDAPPREKSTLYAGGNLLHRSSKGFHPHAYDFPTRSFPTLEEAEKELHLWYLEFC